MGTLNDMSVEITVRTIDMATCVNSFRSPDKKKMTAQLANHLSKTCCKQSGGLKGSWDGSLKLGHKFGQQYQYMRRRNQNCPCRILKGLEAQEGKNIRMVFSYETIQHLYSQQTHEACCIPRSEEVIRKPPRLHFGRAQRSFFQSGPL